MGGGEVQNLLVPASLEIVTRILQWSLSVQGELHTFGLVHLTHSSISCLLERWEVFISMVHQSGVLLQMSFPLPE